MLYILSSSQLAHEFKSGRDNILSLLLFIQNECKINTDAQPISDDKPISVRLQMV